MQTQYIQNTQNKEHVLIRGNADEKKHVKKKKKTERTRRRGRRRGRGRRKEGEYGRIKTTKQNKRTT